MGFTATIVLGLAVRSGDSGLDRWFMETSQELLGKHPYWMLALNRVRVLVPLYLLAIGIPMWRREWRLATVAALCPLISIIGAKVLKVWKVAKKNSVLMTLKVSMTMAKMNGVNSMIIREKMARMTSHKQIVIHS